MKWDKENDEKLGKLMDKGNIILGVVIITGALVLWGIGLYNQYYG